MTALTSDDTALLICRASGALDEGTVGVNLALASQPSPAVLCAHPGDPLSRTEAVQVQGFAEIPPGTLAIGPALAARLELGLPNAAWRLDNDAAQLSRAETLELELTVDRPLQQAADELEAGQLAGRLLYLPAPGQLGGLALSVHGEDYRVRRVTPEPSSARPQLYAITPETEVTLFASGVRAAVDIVVLADTSRSMGVPDLSGGDQRAVTRMDAVKRALEGLFSTRLENPGRSARFALVAFSDECRLCFPSVGGMAELNAEAAQPLRRAIASLQPKGETNLGRALQFAGELLAKHSAPNSERLIVLISDGADTQRSGEGGTGEVLYGFCEPVSLMEDLAEQRDVRLHAINISSPQAFDAFVARLQRTKGYAGSVHPSWKPNHPLLRELIEVGGGDPKHIGDTRLLSDYLTRLGRGVTHAVRLGAPEPSALTPAERAFFADYARDERRRTFEIPRQKRLQAVVRELQDIWEICNELGKAVIAAPLLQQTQQVNAALHGDLLWRHHVIKGLEFRGWWLPVHQVFDEARHEDCLRIPGLREILRSERAVSLWSLRHWGAHDLELRKETGSYERAKKTMLALIGRSDLAEDDHERWSDLQLAALTELKEISQQVRACLERAQLAHQEGRFQLLEPPRKPSELPARALPTLVYLSAPAL